MRPSRPVALRQVEDKPKSKSDGVQQMIQLILCFLFAIILIPVALFVGCFVFLVAMTIIYTPIAFITDLFNKDKFP